MRDDEKAAFIDDVMAAADQIELSDTLGTAHKALDFGAPPNPADGEMHAAKSTAQQLVQDPGVLARLCPALHSASDDLGVIAKTVGTALLPLALTPAAIVPLSSLVFGAVAVLIARAGVKAICPEPAHAAKGADD